VFLSTIPETICITGGTGSFGSAMTACLMNLSVGPSVRVFSRDEDKQERMQATWPPGPRLTYILGDVRDSQALRYAFDGATGVIHSAALKHVPQGERHPDEFKKTNVDGTENIVQAAIECHIPRSLFISSDKAVQPVTEYGRGKAVAEGLFRQGNQLGLRSGCHFSTVRGGNVWNSRGSVVELWARAIRKKRPLYLSNPDTTRFFIHMEDWTAFCWRVWREMHGGEIFIPKLRAWRLGDLAVAFGVKMNVKPIERPMDKRHECLIAPEEFGRTIDIGWAYVIEPPSDVRQVWNYNPWLGKSMLYRLGDYSSQTTHWLSVDELRELVKVL